MAFAVDRTEPGRRHGRIAVGDAAAGSLFRDPGAVAHPGGDQPDAGRLRDSPADSAGVVERETHSGPAMAGLVLFQFVVAVYGGYFGAAMGILMLSALTLMGIGDINRMNAVKTVLTACVNGISVVVFAFDDKIEWAYALPMALFAIVGGYLGARIALRIHPRRVRWIVIAIGFGLSGWFFYRQHAGS